MNHEQTGELINQYIALSKQAPIRTELSHSILVAQTAWRTAHNIQLRIDRLPVYLRGAATADHKKVADLKRLLALHMGFVEGMLVGCGVLNINDAGFMVDADRQIKDWFQTAQPTQESTG